MSCPQPGSDLYTVGRALAVLSFEFRGFQGRYRDSLPDAVQVVGTRLDGTVQALAVPSGAEVVASMLADLAAGDPSDWRLAWYHGLRSLALAADARGAFSAVYSELPGEAAPKLALAFAAEAAGDPANAGHYFSLVWSVDWSCVSAAFGLTRACLATGRLGQLGVDDLRREQLTVEILRAALDWCGTGQPTGKGPIAGCEPNPRALRFGLERSYRALARLTPDEDRRIELVDMANAIRPRTLT